MGEWNTEAFASELEAALDNLDRQRAAELCAQLVAHLARDGDTYPEMAARRHLKALRNKRYFELVALVADRLLRARPGSHWVARDHAQALLDLGEVAAAIAVLERMKCTANGVSADVSCEIEGLLGRAYKQIYVDAGGGAWAHEALRRSIGHYLAVYQGDRGRLWHGINAATLLFRARRDGVEGVDDVAADVAREIVATIERRELADQLTAWDRATAAEALIGLGDYKRAAVFLAQYVNDGQCDAFELASTYRQLTEVVQLAERPGDERLLVDVLRGALLKRQNGAFVATGREICERAASGEEIERGLQRVFGADAYLDHGWLLRAFRRATGVARVKARGRTFGTAFLIPGTMLHPDWTHQVVLTNNHVVSKQLRITSLRPSEVEIAFDAHPARPSEEVEAVLWESPIGELDVTVMKLRRPIEGIEDMPVAPAIPELREPPPPRMYIIGHPKGSDLAYSLHDNHLLGVTERRMHYRSPTDEGSSGSPVFDDHWNLIAIHRRGDHNIARLDDPTKTYDANEGVPMQTILRAIGAR